MTVMPPRGENPSYALIKQIIEKGKSVFSHFIFMAYNYNVNK